MFIKWLFHVALVVNVIICMLTHFMHCTVIAFRSSVVTGGVEAQV